MTSYQKIINNGLWTNNQALVALLGLCPLLAVSTSVANALGLGIATIFVLIASNTTISLLRYTIAPEIRIPVFVLLIASFVTIAELLIQSYFYDLYLILGIFVPLIVTNCAILGRAEAFASKNTWDKSLLDGLMMGIGFTLVLVVLGAMRELIGNGTLFNNAHLLFGESARDITISIEGYQGNLLAILPPGAFIALGLLVAFKNYYDQVLVKAPQTESVQINIQEISA